MIFSENDSEGAQPSTAGESCQYSETKVRAAMVRYNIDIKARMMRISPARSVVDVQKWLRRHCGDYYHLYAESFLEQEVTGRCLVRMNENSLMRLGIIHPEHRQFIWREIAKLRLRTSILYLRDQERRLGANMAGSAQY